MIAARRMLAMALILGAGVALSGCVYNPYTGTFVPCCGYYGYPYYGYPYYRYPPPYYYGPQSAPYYAPPPASQPGVYPGPQQGAPPPQPQPGAGYPHAERSGPTQPFAVATA
jgi:hypothetical protein